MKTIRRFTTSSIFGAQLFLIVALLISVYGVATYGMSLATFGLVLLGYFMYGCLGIVVTYHRYLTHNGYSTSPWLVKLFSLFGVFAGTGSPLAWANIHVNHHLYSDKPGDPHSPLIDGVKIFTLEYKVKDKTRFLKHILSDGYQRMLHRYYFLVLVSYSILLYAIGGLYLMVFLHLLPAAITAIMSNVVNFVGHKPEWFGGYRTFNLKDTSANNWLWAIPSWGESWHNNHHRFPKNYTFAQKWYEFDIAGLIIKTIKT